MNMGKQSRRRAANQSISQFSGCTHNGAAVAPLRKGVAKSPDFSMCKECLRLNKKSTDTPETPQVDPPAEGDVTAPTKEQLFACLRCCHIACERHVTSHFKAPRSDIHSHYMSLETRKIICAACQGQEIEEGEHHVIANCVQIVAQALKRANPSASLVESADDWRALALRKAHSEAAPANKTEPTSAPASSKLSAPPKQTPLGLPNLGSTCYLNSSLQGLAATCAVRKCFSQFTHQQCKVLLPNGGAEPPAEVVLERQEGALPERLADVLRRIRPFDSEWCDEGYCSTKPMRNRLVGLKTEFAHRYPDFSSDTTEQDSHEFLRYFLDLLSQNVDKRVNEARKEGDGGATLCGSVIDGLFRCTLLTIRHCSNCCGFSTKTEHVLDLCLALDKDVSGLSPVRCSERKSVVTASAVSLSKHKLKKAKKERRKMKKKRHLEPGSSGPTSPSLSKEDADLLSEEMSSEDAGEVKTTPADEEEEEEVDTNDYNFFDCAVLGTVEEAGETTAEQMTKGNSSVDSAIVVSGDDSDNQSGGSAAAPPGVNEPVSKFHDVFSWTAHSASNCAGDLPVLDLCCPDTVTAPAAAVATELSPDATAEERTEALIRQLMSEDIQAGDEEVDGNSYAAFWDDIPAAAPLGTANVSISSESLVSKNFSDAGNSIDCNVSHSNLSNDSVEVCARSLTLDLAEEEGELKEVPEVADEEKGKTEEEKEKEEKEPERDLEPDVAKVASETMWSLPEVKPSSLEALLSKYFQLSPIEDFRCGRCKAQGTSSSRQCLIELPPVLLINMKRFWRPLTGHGETRKINSAVEFPIQLDIGAFTSRLASPASTRYRLRGLIQHIGSVRSGHYVAFVSVNRGSSSGPQSEQPALRVTAPPTIDHLTEAFERLGTSATTTDDTGVAEKTEEEGEEWFLVSDTSVSRASVRDVLSAEAYILLYERLAS